MFSASPWLNEHVHRARSDNLADLSSRRPDGHRVPANGDIPSVPGWYLFSPSDAVSFANFTQETSCQFRRDTNLRLDRQTVEGHRGAYRVGKLRGKHQRYQNGDRSWNLHNESA
jgi:hypothetical protein